jgi:hypothetical protein
MFLALRTKGIAAAAAPTGNRRALVGAPEGAMLPALRSHKHRGCRRSHRDTARPCGSAGRRDASRTSKPQASRLPPLPQGIGALLWERRKARCFPHFEATSIAAAAPTGKRRALVGAPEGAMLPALRSHKHRGCRRSHRETRALVGAPEGAMLPALRSHKHRGCRRSHRESARSCGSAGRRDASRTSKPQASRLPPLLQSTLASAPRALLGARQCDLVAQVDG